MYDLLHARFDNETSDRSEGKTPPPFELEKFKAGVKIALAGPREFTQSTKSFEEILEERKSLRKFSKDPMSLVELSKVLYYTYGNRKTGEKVIRKFVPSGAERYGEDLFVIAMNVEGLAMGIYYYSPSEHVLYQVAEEPELKEKIVDITKGQIFVGNAQVFLFLVAVPERISYAYPRDFEKLAILDAGHIMGQAILVGESLGLGSCPIGKYDQERMDELLHLSEEEVSIYGLIMGKES